MSETSFKLLQKNTCTHKENKCNHLLPFSLIELQGKEKFTKEEKNENLKKYKNSCKNQAGIYTSCCDKNDTKLEKVFRKIKIPKLRGKVEYDRYDKLNSIKLCKDKKCKDSRKLTAYEMCKIGEDYIKNEDHGEITKFSPDCFLTQCNPQEKVPNILGTIGENYTYEIDRNISSAIEKNDIPMIKYYIQKDPSLKKRVLTHNQEGNTIYHETLKFNSGNNLYYIFKQASKEISFKQNLKGDTILHMAMCIDTPNSVMFALKLGCDINERNNLGETPIYCAIRSDRINNVRMSINNIASLDIKNKNGDTPLLISLRMDKKNVDIVRLLVERGSDISTKDKNGKNALQIINDIKKPIIEDEEVRTYLEQISIQNMGIKMGEKKELNSDETRKMKGIVYNLENEKLLIGDTKFKIDIDYTGEGDKYYPDDLDETYMQPYKPGDKNLSHEPYFQKFKNLQKDKLDILKKTILLTKWDNKNNKNKKLKIIDDIMEDKLNFDSYKYEVMSDNGITIEQEHMLFKDFSPPPANSVTLKVKGEKQTPYDITDTLNQPLDQPLDLNQQNPPLESPTYTLDNEHENNLINSFTPTPTSSYIDRTLFEIIKDFIGNYSSIFLFLAIIITFGIIFVLYIKSKETPIFKMNGGFKKNYKKV